jgi:two-component system, response regulator RegA
VRHPVAKRVLIVEDDPDLGIALSHALSRQGVDSQLCPTIHEAVATLLCKDASWHPDLLILDVSLPDGTAFDLLHALKGHAPRARIVAISGQAAPEECFKLGLLGVQRFLPKPFEMRTLEAVLQETLHDAPDIDVQLRLLVGKQPLRDIEKRTRSTLVEEAMARTGSIRAAARMLAISRQLLQHILRSASPHDS